MSVWKLRKAPPILTFRLLGSRVQLIEALPCGMINCMDDSSTNIFGLLFSVGFLACGALGILRGRVSIWNAKAASGPGAIGLSIIWILVGILGTVAFGGAMLGIKEVMPLYNAVKPFMNRNHHSHETSPGNNNDK